MKKTMMTMALFGLMALTAMLPTVSLAESPKDPTRVEKLEERVRDLEARLAKVEATTHKDMAAMGHAHGMDMMKQGMGMKDKWMGDSQKGNAQTDPNPGSAPQGGMQQGGGMGDM